MKFWSLGPKITYSVPALSQSIRSKILLCVLFLTELGPQLDCKNVSLGWSIRVHIRVDSEKINAEKALISTDIFRILIIKAEQRWKTSSMWRSAFLLFYHSILPYWFRRAFKAVLKAKQCSCMYNPNVCTIQCFSEKKSHPRMTKSFGRNNNNTRNKHQGKKNDGVRRLFIN